MRTLSLSDLNLLCIIIYPHCLEIYICEILYSIHHIKALLLHTNIMQNQTSLDYNIVVTATYGFDNINQQKSIYYKGSYRKKYFLIILLIIHTVKYSETIARSDKEIIYKWRTIVICSFSATYVRCTYRQQYQYVIVQYIMFVHLYDWFNNPSSIGHCIVRKSMHPHSIKKNLACGAIGRHTQLKNEM